MKHIITLLAVIALASCNTNPPQPQTAPENGSYELAYWHLDAPGHSGEASYFFSHWDGYLDLYENQTSITLAAVSRYDVEQAPMYYQMTPLLSETAYSQGEIMGDMLVPCALVTRHEVDGVRFVLGWMLIGGEG